MKFISYGHLLFDVEPRMPGEYHVWEFIRDTDEFANVRNRLSYQKVLNGDPRNDFHPHRPFRLPTQGGRLSPDRKHDPD